MTEVINQQGPRDPLSVQGGSDLSPSDQLAASALLSTSGGMPVEYRVSDSMIVPFSSAVVDPGHAFDVSIYEFLRSKHVQVPVILSVFFQEQFSKAAVGLASASTVALYMAQILNYAVAFQNKNKQEEAIAALTTLAAQYDLNVDDVLGIYQAAVAKLDSVIMTSSSNYLAAATLAGTASTADAHKLLIGDFDYSTDDLVRARIALTTILDEIPQSADIIQIHTTLAAVTATIQSFPRVQELIKYRTGYSLPRTPMSIGSLVASVRQYQPDSYDAVKLPRRVKTSRAEQYRYHTLDKTFAGSVTVADIMATIQALDIELFALPVPNMPFIDYINQSVLASDVPFSPALIAPGRDLREDPAMQDLLKLCLLTDSISTRGSQILAFAMSYLDKYRMTESNAKFFPEVRNALAALITIVEHPLQFRATLESILARVDHLSLRVSSVNGQTQVLPRESINRWISARAKGLTPLAMRAVDTQSSAVLYSLAIANSLPPLFEFKLPSVFTIGAAPWYHVSDRGAVNVPRIPVTRNYQGKAVFTSIPPRHNLDSKHNGALARLVPSVTTHGTFTLIETPVSSSEMVGALVAHFPLDELAAFGSADDTLKNEPTVMAALRQHVLASARDTIRSSDSPLLAAISSQNFDQLSISNGTWSDIVNLTGVAPVPVLSDVPLLNVSEMYFVSDHNFIVLFTYDDPIRHERSGIGMETASSTAPLIVMHRQPVEHPVFVPLEKVFSAKAVAADALRPLVLDSPADPLPMERAIRHQPAQVKVEADAPPEAASDNGTADVV